MPRKSHARCHSHTGAFSGAAPAAAPRPKLPPFALRVCGRAEYFPPFVSCWGLCFSQGSRSLAGRGRTTQGIAARLACAHLHGRRGTKRWRQLREGSELAALQSAGWFYTLRSRSLSCQESARHSPGSCRNQGSTQVPRVEDRLTLTL